VFDILINVIDNQLRITQQHNALRVTVFVLSFLFEQILPIYVSWALYTNTCLH